MKKKNGEVVKRVCLWHAIADHNPTFLVIGTAEDSDIPMEMFRLDEISELQFSELTPSELHNDIFEDNS